ncbi:hypothetical protein VDGD_00675 [Verticillium dahliae]|nr:Fizzy-related protein-like protein [Verticillium dahliae VDG1]RBQ89988.1 hypothetical protein VDGD_00675 [Verticillium dahliae]
MEDAQEAQVAFLDDLFSLKFAIHDVIEDDFFSSEEREIDTTSPEESEKQSSEDDLAELLELINSIKLLPGSSKISYATAGMFNGVNSHPIDTGAFFQVRKLDQPAHNRQIVAKYPRLDPARKGGGISRKNIEAIKLEIQALSHQPILDHPNVVDLLGFSWARMSAAEERSQIVPVLLLEFASHGTLRDYLCDNATSPAERLRLGKGLGEGLDALHKSGIVHGDLKLENALVFDHPDGGVVAKLADFGSAVQLLEGGYQYRGGTPPWTAPEWRKSIEPWEQHAADIYSFGLLIWTLCLEGRNPFSGLSANEIEDRKTRDVTESDAVKSVADHYEFFRHAVDVSTELEQFELYLTSVICPRKAFRYTLRFDTHQRDLGAALSALSVVDFYGANEDQDESTSKESPLMLKEYKSINTYTKLTDMPEQVRQCLFRTFTAAVNESQAAQLEKAGMCFQLGLACLDGFTSYWSIPAALTWLEKAATLGSEAARGVIYRIFCATARSKLEQDPELASRLRGFLATATAMGSSSARRSLLELDVEAARVSTEAFKGRFLPEGMGAATTRLDKEVLEAVIHPRWQEGLSPGQKTKFQDQRSRTYLNRKKGSILHFASAYGVSRDGFEAFLDLEKPDVNAKDTDGNTPLLMAMRTGHAHLALALLRYGADPNASNDLGQRACHWAIQVDDQGSLEELISVMLSKGADLEAVAKRTDVSDGQVYRQEQYEGTPLFWAAIEGREDVISALLKNGACPTTPGIYMSPFDLAVGYNDWRTIRLFSQYAQHPITSRIVGPTRSENIGGSLDIITEDWVSFAMCCFPRHYHMMRHGHSYGDALKLTLVELKRAKLLENDVLGPLRKALQSGGPMIDDLLWYQSCRMRPVSSWDLAEMFIDEASHISPDAASILLDGIAADEGNGPLPDLTPLLFTYPSSHRAEVGIFSRLLDLINPASVDIPDVHGVTSYRHVTPFMLAVLGGAFEFATELLKRGADPNFETVQVNLSGTASVKVNILHLLILVNEDTSLAGLRYLLEPQHPFHDRKPDFVVCKELGLTALTYAARWGNTILFNYLFNHFHSSEELDMRGLTYGDTALHTAAIHGNYDVAVSLVNRGAKINVLAHTKDGKLMSPLDFCYDTDTYSTNVPRTSRHWEGLWVARLRTAKFLAGRGGRMLVRHAMPIAFHFLVHACSGNWPRLFAEALEQTPEDLKTREYLDTLLFRAADSGSEDVVSLLIDAGACVNTRSARGQTPLHRAAQRGYMYVARVLVQRGADVRLRDDKSRTAAVQAFTHDHDSLVMYLLAQGSPRNLPTMTEVPYTVDYLDRRTNTTSTQSIIATVCFLHPPMPEEPGASAEEADGTSYWVLRVRRPVEGGEGVDEENPSLVAKGSREKERLLINMRGEGFQAAWKAAQERANESGPASRRNEQDDTSDK